MVTRAVRGLGVGGDAARPDVSDPNGSPKEAEEQTQEQLSYAATFMASCAYSPRGPEGLNPKP